MQYLLVILVMLLLFNVIICSNNNNNIKKKLSQEDKDKMEFQYLQSLKPISNNSSKLTFLMFWRPQKVGSSTILSILTSYGYRFNMLARRKGTMNSLCKKIAQCFIDTYDSAKPTHIYRTLYNNFQVTSNMYNLLQSYVAGRAEGAGPVKGKGNLDIISEKLPYYMSVQHNLCNLNSRIIQEELLCSFNYKNIITNDINTIETKQIFVIRNPLDRMISIYYFWGELFKLAALRFERKKKNNNNNNQRHRIGSQHSGPVDGNLFSYHGNESTIPPIEYAMPFSQRLPLNKGMPGPTLSWSGFSNNLKDAIRILESDYMMTIVSERLDESLVVASKFLGWSLADVVVTIYRKALSKHPKAHEWPEKAIEQINKKLEECGEKEMYEVANKRLDERITELKSNGIDVDKEIQILKDLRKRTSELCHTELYLAVYKKKLEDEGYDEHFSDNRLRDAEDLYSDNGHAFSFNRDILYSFDVCGNCESHAFLLALNLGIATTVSDAPSLSSLDPKYTSNNINFLKCPKREDFTTK